MESLSAISLFSGIEGFGLGLERAGGKVVAHVEIDKECQRLLRDRWNSNQTRRRDDAPAEGGVGDRAADSSSSDLFGDIRTVGAHNLPAADAICGGFPCQDLSVAGNRAGLAGDRSGLWYEFHRILAELRPRWVVIENVPGLLSSQSGRDMAIVLGGLAKLGYGWAYRVLDAQYFGVAQSRRRVFIVGCLGDTGAAVQVLFEPESCDGDSAPSRQARQGIAASLTSGSGVGSNDPGRRREDDVNLVSAVTSKWAKGTGGPAGDEAQNLVPEVAPTLSGAANRTGGVRPPGTQVDTAESLIPFVRATRPHGAGDTERWEQAHVALALNGWDERHNPPPHLVTHTLSSEGHDGSEDGTGRGTPMVVETLRSHPGPGSATPGAVAVQEAQTGVREYDTAGSLRADAPGTQPTGTLTRKGMAVRRLTPTECERLQGFPDGWTAGTSDSARYRMLGNAVCVSVAEWIWRRVILVHNSKFGGTQHAA